jgi:hypothetical protein
VSLPTIYHSVTPIPRKCRCGAPIPSAGTVIRVTSASDSLESLFRDEVFCSPNCVRAFCLESLEIVGPLDTPIARAIVSDLHDLHRGLTETMSQA